MLTVDLSGFDGVIANAVGMAAADTIAALPDVHWPAGGEVRFRTTASNLRHLRANLTGATWRDPRGRLVELEAQDALDRAGHRPPDDTDRAYPFKTRPVGRQLEAFAFARHLPYFALFCDPGTGKTWICANVAAAKFEANEIDCLLVITPNGVNAQWVHEQLPKHLPDIEYRATVYKPGVRAMREAMAPLDGGLRILAVNVEALSRGNAIKDVVRFAKSGRCMTAVDESTRIKNHRAKRTKSILQLRDLSAVRCILTGTPITKGVTDLFSQLLFLHPDILGFSNFARFRDRYCITAPAYRGAAMGVVKVIGHRNLQELIDRIAPYCFRMTKEGLPEKVYERRDIPLSDEQRQHYNNMVTVFRTELEAGSLTAVNAAARTGRLQQILSGYLPRNDDDSGDVQYFPQHRTQSLLDLLEELGDDCQVVVWYRFQMDGDLIAAALTTAGISHVVCDGRVPADERQRRKGEFVSGRARVYAANPAAVGTGTDGLQCAPVAVIYSHTFDAEQTWQAEDRTHRHGMTEDGGTYYQFAARGTVDELFLTNNEDKRTLAERIIDNPSILQTV